MERNVRFRQVVTKAMAMCSQSERCRFDMVTKLRHWELTEDEITEVIDSLIKERFLDEERFVRFYINDKLQFNKWGKTKLTFLLRQKQIPEELIRTALSHINDDFYEKILLELLLAKIKQVKGVSDYERRGKLALFAQSHGFEADLAFKVASQIVDNNKISKG